MHVDHTVRDEFRSQMVMPLALGGVVSGALQSESVLHFGSEFESGVASRDASTDASLDAST